MAGAISAFIWALKEPVKVITKTAVLELRCFVAQIILKEIRQGGDIHILWTHSCTACWGGQDIVVEAIPRDLVLFRMQQKWERERRSMPQVDA